MIMTSGTQNKRGSKVATRAFLISLVVMILMSLVNWGIISSWGKVDITPMTLVGDDGTKYTGILYVPDNATTENPAPAIIMAHGISGNARNHESWAMEFARRGFVALSVDWMGNGDSEYDGVMFNTPRYPALEQYYDYLLDMTIVDHDRIVASGHSMGTDAAFVLSSKYDPIACMLCNLCPPPSFGGDYTYDGNILFLSGTADKSASELTYLPNVQKALDISNRGIENVQYETLYGSFEEGNAVLVTRLQDMIHEGAFVNSECINILLDFAQEAVGIENVPNYISGDNQLWFLKDVAGLIGMFSFLAFILTFAIFLIEQLPFFSTIRQPMPRNIGLRGPGMAISIVAALLFPLIVLYTGSMGIYTLIDKVFSKNLFGGGYANYALAVIIGLNLLGLCMLFLFKFTEGKKKNAVLAEYGLTYVGENKLNFKLIGKALLLALVVLCVAFSYLSLQRTLLGTDFYCLFFGFRPVVWHNMLHYIPYIVVWMICFVIASIGMNVERRLPDTGHPVRDMVVSCVFNSVLAMGVITLMVIIENAVQINIGSTTRALASWGIDISRLWGMPVGMTMAGIGQTYLYRKTGSVWVGAFVMGILCAFCCVLYGQFRL